MSEQPETPNPEETGPGEGQPEEPVVTGRTVLERLGELESGLAQANARAEKAEAEAAKLQSERDRARSRLEKLQQQPPEARGRGGIEDLQTFANDRAREAMVLRALLGAGLTEEDLDVPLEDLESPAEVRAAIKVAQLEKKIAAQDQRLEEAVVDAEELSRQAREEVESQQPSQPPVDTGGPSGIAPAAEVEGPEELRAQAKQLREKGDPDSLVKARWLVLQASYLDDGKVIGRGRGGPTVEG